MPPNLDAFSQDALVLPSEERVAFAYRLLVSAEPSAEEAWTAEIATRIARFDSGEGQTLPAREVFARLRETAPGQ